MTELKEHILRAYSESLEQTGKELLVEKLEDGTVLLESGLDSLGFAILVTILDEELGYDPFTIMKEAVYPNTFGEFFALYEKYNPNK